jgi:hypothetical protein
MKIKATLPPPFDTFSPEDFTWTLNGYPVELSFIERQLDIVLDAVKQAKTFKEQNERLTEEVRKWRDEACELQLKLKEQGK